MSGKGRGRRFLLPAAMALCLIILLTVSVRRLVNEAVPKAGYDGGAVTLALIPSPGGGEEDARRAAKRLGESLSREVMLTVKDEAGAAGEIRGGACDAAVGYLPCNALPGFGLMKSRPLKRKAVFAVSKARIASLDDLAGVNAGYLSGFAPEQEQALEQAEDVRLHLYGEEEALWADLAGGMTQCALVDRETARRFLERAQNPERYPGADGRGDSPGLRAVRLTDAPVRELYFFTNSRELIEEINRIWEGE